MRNRSAFYILILTIFMVTSSAHAGKRWEALKVLLGIGDTSAATSTRRGGLRMAGEVAGDAETPLARATANGEIWPAEFPPAQDPFHKPKYGNLFSSMQSETLVRTVGQEDLVDEVQTVIEDTSVLGYVVVGPKGSGKTQVGASAVEYAFRKNFSEATRVSQDGRNYVIRVDTSRPEFANFEKFQNYARALMNDMPELNEADTVVFHIDGLVDMAREAERSGNASAQLAHYIRILEDMSSESLRVRVGLEMEQATYDTLIKGTSLESRFAKPIVVKAADEASTVSRIVESHLPLEDPNGVHQLSQRKVGLLITWIQRYMPGGSQSDSALQIIRRAKARRAKFLKYEDPQPDEYVRALEAREKDLIEQIEKVKDMQGAYARELQTTLPGDLRRVQEDLYGLAEKELDDAIQAMVARGIPEEDAKKLVSSERGARYEYQVRLALRDKLKEVEEAMAKIDDKHPDWPALQTHWNDIMDQLDIISHRDLALVVSRHTGVPLEKILRNAGRMTLDEFFHLVDNTLFGMPALNALLKLVARKVHKAVTEGNFHAFKPIARVLLTGPAGTGKTEFGRLLSQFMDGYMRIDGADFKEKAWLSRLLGSAPGYKEYEKGGSLANHLEAFPVSLVHFDEPELADPEVMDVLQKMIDPGGVDDGLKKVPTNRVVIVVSTNAIQDLPENVDANSLGSMRNAIHSVAGHIFSLPLLNRFNYILHVPRPNHEGLLQIAEKTVREMNDRLLLGKNFMKVKISDEAREALVRYAKATIDENPSARDIQNVIEQFIEEPLSMNIMESGYFMIPGTNRVRQISFREGDILEFTVNEQGQFIPRILP